MTDFKRKCHACSQGTIKLQAKAGRTWNYKHVLLEVPVHFEIPTCDHCGEQWLTPEKAEALEDILQIAIKNTNSSCLD